MNWEILPRSERAQVGPFQCDVWPIGGGARYSVFDMRTLKYMKGGQCASLEWAKQVSAGFAESLVAQ